MSTTFHDGTVFSLLDQVLDRFSSGASAAAAVTIGVRAAAAYVVDTRILKSRQAAARLWPLLPGDHLAFTGPGR